MFSKIVDENLELHLVSEKYAEELNSLIHKNLEHISEWVPWATENYSVDSAKEFIKAGKQRFVETEMADFLILENKKLIGIVGFNRPDLVHKSVEIGYWLDKNKTGKGIITRCCKILIDYAFKEQDFNRISIKCATGNFKSQAIPERLGFTKEGIARQDEKLHDKFIDLIVYSMLKEEWR
jgi:ribosomal-protein-serine acetyltransferase